MASRRDRARRQPRDSRGRFAPTGIPLWAVVLVAAVVGAWLAR